VVIGFVICGYFVIWAEIQDIRDLIPVKNRAKPDSCYNHPLLNLQIWTKEGHFHPLYKMEDVVIYAVCLETAEAIHRAQIFYVSYYIVLLAFIMTIFVFMFEMTGMRWKSGLQIVFIPTIFGVGEAVLIFYLLEGYKNEDIGGLDETLCQLCGIVGIVFWLLFAFIILFLIGGFLGKCRKLCSNDRQRGVQMVTVRDLDGVATIYGRGTYEMMNTPRSKQRIDLAKTGLF